MTDDFVFLILLTGMNSIGPQFKLLTVANKIQSEKRFALSTVMTLTRNLITGIVSVTANLFDMLSRIK